MLSISSFHLFDYQFVPFSIRLPICLSFSLSLCCLPLCCLFLYLSVCQYFSHTFSQRGPGWLVLSITFAKDSKSFLFQNEKTRPCSFFFCRLKWKGEFFIVIYNCSHVTWDDVMMKETSRDSRKLFSKEHVSSEWRQWVTSKERHDWIKLEKRPSHRRNF